MTGGNAEPRHISSASQRNLNSRMAERPKNGRAGNPIYNITSSILASNHHGGGDLEEMFINAARDGAHERLQSLLNQHGDSLVSIDLKDKRTGNTALIWAAKRGHTKIIQLLLRHNADITLRNYDGQSAIEVASPIIKGMLLDHVNQGFGSSPARLLQAAWIGNHEIVHHILSNGRALDINCSNSDGFTPLLLCTRDLYMFEKLGSQMAKNYQPTYVLQQLMQCRATDISACDLEGKTALHYAVSSKSNLAIPITSLLLTQSGVNVTSLRDRRDLTALHYACQAGNTDIVQMLVESNSDVNCRGFAGTTPLHIAAFTNHDTIAMILLEHGADPNITDDSGQTPIDVAKMRKLRNKLKSWSEGNGSQIELAPVRLPGTPRSRQTSAAGASRVPTAGSDQLAFGNVRSGVGDKKIHQKDSVRLLGAPRSLQRGNSRDKLLSPLNINSQSSHRSDAVLTHDELIHKSGKQERSHSTSDLEFANKNRSATVTTDGTVSAQSRADGVISVEILGLSSADKRRRLHGNDLFYSRSPAQHDILISNHGQPPRSPSMRPSSFTPYNLPDITSASPLLSTIHEDNSNTLPRSVMMESDMLRQVRSPPKLPRQLSTMSVDYENDDSDDDDTQDLKSPVKESEGGRSIFKSEFVLEESRTEDHKSHQPSKQQKHQAQNSSTEFVNKSQQQPHKTPTAAANQLKKPPDVSNKLQAAARDNALMNKEKPVSASSHSVPKTVVTTILTHATRIEDTIRQVNPSNNKGKITVHRDNLLTNETPLSTPTTQRTQDAGTTAKRDSTQETLQTPKVKALQKASPTTPGPRTNKLNEQRKVAVSNNQKSKVVSSSHSSKSESKQTPQKLVQIPKGSNGNYTCQTVANKSTTSHGAKTPVASASPRNTKSLSAGSHKEQINMAKIVPHTSNAEPSTAVSVTSPRRPDRPLTRRVSYGSRTSKLSSSNTSVPVQNQSKVASENQTNQISVSSTTSELQHKEPTTGIGSSADPNQQDADFNELLKAKDSTVKPYTADLSPSIDSGPHLKFEQVQQLICNENPTTEKENTVTAGISKCTESSMTDHEPAAATGPSEANQNHLTVHRSPQNTSWTPKSRESLLSQSSYKSPSRTAVNSYQPLHLLMNFHSKNNNNNRFEIDPETQSAQEDKTPPQAEERNEVTDPPVEKMEVDQALTLTFSEQERLPAEYQGPVIHDLFENFPRPIFELAQIVAKDMEKQAAAKPRKKKKKISVKVDSRNTSAIKSRRTKGVQAGTDDGKKRVKSAKKRKGKTNSKAIDTNPEEPEPSKDEKMVLISGTDWHIETERASDVEIIVERSDTDAGETTCDESDGEGVKAKRKVKKDFAKMTPRQKREELRNLLLMMRNVDPYMSAHTDSVTSTLLPETMQAIHEFINAVPNEHELNRLFGLDSSLKEDHVAEVQQDECQVASEDEESIPDVSEIEINGDEEEQPALLLDEQLGLSPPHNSLKRSIQFATKGAHTESNESCAPLDCKDLSGAEANMQAKKLADRCVSTAMTDIIDEILNTPRLSPPPATELNSEISPPKVKLPDHLVKEIHEEWEKASQSASNTDTTSSSTTNTNSQSLTTNSSHSTKTTEEDEAETSSSNESDDDSESPRTESSSGSDVDILDYESKEIKAPVYDSLNKSRPPIPHLPRDSSSPKPKSSKTRGKIKIDFSQRKNSTNSFGSKKGNLSFSEVDKLNLNEDGDDTKTASMKNDIRSRPNSRTVVSRLGTRRSSCHDDASVTGLLTHRSSASEDSQILRWKKGNMLGKGAYGKVYCGLTSDGHLIAVKQIELNVHDWDKAEKEYESVQEEVQLLKTLKHANIVGFLGTSLDESTVSIFMQFVPGGTIASLLSRFGALEERVFQRYTLQIVNGVSYLHDNGVIHRDIKGANIMLMSNGIIKLIDFGCAKRLCLNLSVSQSEILKSMKGTPYWMAPEVIKETGHGYKSDIWSIGCTVFEMATTKPPWSEMQPMAAIFAIGSDKPIPSLPDTCSRDAKEFLDFCMQRDPNLRLSAKELIETQFLSNL